MGAPDLDDFGEGLGLAVERGVQMLQRRNEPMRYFLSGGDMHRGRKHVVRRLAHIDVIVGMDRRLGAARAAEDLVGAIGDHLVDVHVGLRARAGLIDRERKMVVELAVEDFLCRLRDRLGAPCVEEAERAIGFGGGALHQRQRRDQRARHALFADREIMPRALGLCAPIGLRRHFDRTEGIGFGAGFHPGIRTNPIVFRGCGAA